MVKVSSVLAMKDMDTEKENTDTGMERVNMVAIDIVDIAIDTVMEKEKVMAAMVIMILMNIAILKWRAQPKQVSISVLTSWNMHRIK